jgi:FtsH ternary system domain X7
MSEGPPRFAFNIRKLPREPVPETVAPPRLGEPKPVVGPARDDDSSALPEAEIGARFSNTGAVLAYLSGMSADGIPPDAVVRRIPDGNWWVESGATLDGAFDLIVAAAGRAYRRRGDEWFAVRPDGMPLRARAGRDVVEPRHWESVDLAVVVSYAPLMGSRYIGSRELNVVLPAELGQWLLRRALSIGLRAWLTTVTRHPLHGGDASKALLVRLESDVQAIPATFVHAVCGLPYCVACGPRQTGQGTLLLDVRHRLPFPARLLTGAIPLNETWVLGLADSGSWRVSASGAEIDGASLLELPELPVIPVPPSSGTGRLPETIQIRIIDHPSSESVDAILLDDFELEAARTLLMSRPIGEVAFFIPGDERHLLRAPGGLGSAIPFGIPLVRIGPGPLFIELGKALFPPMPEAARRARFAVEDDSVVAIAGGAAYRFSTDRLTPAWTLWVGEAPVIREGLSPKVAAILNRVGEDTRRREIEAANGRQAETSWKGRKSKPADLVAAAEKEERRGHLFKAAELLEAAGYPARAARLFERAARESR